VGLWINMDNYGPLNLSKSPYYLDSLSVGILINAVIVANILYLVYVIVDHFVINNKSDVIID